ncbi:MAG: Gfo/Idh/MocA family oxidoreductase [Cytophagales bacterium]|nr:Gfo/Idh/MocA family oxidoreductase [Cytophagales bacterium]
MRPIKTGIASYGMSGLVFHAPLLHVHPGFEMLKIVERSYKGSKERYPYISICKSFEELIHDDQLELIVVNTPDATHFDYCRMALDAGKNVVVEKPFTMKASEAEELISRSKACGKLLSVFQNRRWDGDYLTVKKVIREQLVGRLVAFESHFDRYRNFIQPDTWKEEPNAGAEIVYNLGAHMIDQAYELFGMPKSVSADIGIQRTNGLVDDFYNIVLRYEDIHASLRSSYMVREEGPRYILHGTEGSFLKWGIDPQEEALKAKRYPDEQGWGVEPKRLWGKLNTEINGLHYIGKIETVPGNYLAFYDNIYKALRNGAELIVKPEQSLDLMRIIEATVESDRTGHAVRF